MKFIVTVRGKLRGDEKTAQAIHDAAVAQLSVAGRAMGSTAHTAFLNSQDRREFLAIDEWDNPEGIQKLYGDPQTQQEIGKMFDGMPEVVVWVASGWSGYRDK